MQKYVEILRKYSPSEESFGIVLRHSLEVLSKSIEIVSRKSLYDEVDFDLIVSGAILHDIGAMEFIERKKGDDDFTRKGVGKTELPDYICHGMIGASILEKEGLEREALIAKRHTGAGLAREEIVANGWDMLHEDFLPVSLEEKIICYADKFSSKTPSKKDTLETIEKEFESYGEGPLKRFLELKEMFE